MAVTSYGHSRLTAATDTPFLGLNAMPDIVVHAYAPRDVLFFGAQGPPPFDQFAARCLAQGDSWFSIGALPPWATSNLLAQLVLSKSVAVVNCAHPGRELGHMTDTTSESEFLNLLAGRVSWKWDLILLSGGGNDLIDAAQAPPSNMPAQRLLLAAAEWGPPEQGPDRYISEAGWATFASHMGEVMDQFLAVRDGGQNADTPVVFHSYDYPTPRDAPAPLVGPWLYRAMNDRYAIPSADWIALSTVLINRLFALLTELVTQRPQKGLSLIDTRGTIQPAGLGSVGPDGDWQNEIHPTAHGYSLLAQRWRPCIEGLLWPGS